MKQLGTLFLFMILTLIPAISMASEEGHDEDKLNIPEIVLEHLADSYEWGERSHSYASQDGKVAPDAKIEYRAMPHRLAQQRPTLVNCLDGVDGHENNSLREKEQ